MTVTAGRVTKSRRYEAVFDAAFTAGCSKRQAEVIATWLISETLDDAAATLGISQRAVLQHLRLARGRLNVAHNGLLIWTIATPAHMRSGYAAT